MPWPTPADYQEAIQNPKTCFADPELKNGIPITNNLGLPKPISGAFASVYQMDCSGIKHAVRCLLRDYPDIEARYAAISTYLRQVKLPYMAEFEFIRQGIRVRGQWYPILKMEWIDGEPLNAYAQKNLNNTEALGNIIRKFRQMTADLDKVSIAHGDLQHGNILVANRELRLVDYDGMYVPALAGRLSNELGHRNFQHPQRSTKDFGPYLDHFSEWVIITSLMALATRMKLPGGVEIGSDNLLFQREDFADPALSPLLCALEASDSPKLRSLASLLLSFIYISDLSQVPTLDANLISEIDSVSPARMGIDWLRDHVSPSPANTQATGTVADASNAAWVFDHIEAPFPVVFKSSRTVERILLTVIMLLSIAVAGGLFIGLYLVPLYPLVAVIVALAPILIGLSGCLLIIAAGYYLAPETKAKFKLYGKWDELRCEPLDPAALDRELKQKISKAEERGRDRIAETTNRQRTSANKEKAELDHIESKLREVLSTIDATRNASLRAEAEELKGALLELQRQTMDQLLAQHSIASANLPGIGSGLKRRLIDSGISTAADVWDVRVLSSSYGGRNVETVYIERPTGKMISISGIGPAKGEALKVWRQRLEYDHQAELPFKLLSIQENQIKTKHQADCQKLDAQAATTREQARNASDAVRAKYKRERDGVGQELLNISRELEKGRRDLEQVYAEKQKKLAAKRWEMARLEQELRSYEQINFPIYIRQVLFLTNE